MVFDEAELTFASLRVVSLGRDPATFDLILLQANEVDSPNPKAGHVQYTHSRRGLQERGITPSTVPVAKRTTQKSRVDSVELGVPWAG
jgi:hypothetical protein